MEHLPHTPNPNPIRAPTSSTFLARIPNWNVNPLLDNDVTKTYQDMPVQEIPLLKFFGHEKLKNCVGTYLHLPKSHKR